MLIIDKPFVILCDFATLVSSLRDKSKLFSSRFVKNFVFIGLLLLMCCGNNTLKCNPAIKTVNPTQFGLKKAKTGEERFYVLQRTHEEACRRGIGVSYAGIKDIYIVIPSNPKSIPLGSYTDFANVTFTVENKKKDFSLFLLSDSLTSVEVKGKEIDKHDFSRNPVLKKGNKLLVIEDMTPWVENRIGYNYGATREDIMIVKGGKCEHGPVQSYCTSASSPACSYREVDVSAKKIIKNTVFNRTKNSSHKTRFVTVKNQYNVELSNITINTPEGSGLYGDKAIHIINCSDVVFANIAINGTYSLPDRYGYGITLKNTYNVKFYNLYARGNWGVFGNNNVHRAFLKNCDINRFDIHCYGKDISFEDCSFVDLYNQFSSVYGLISFKNCTFTSFTPVLLGHSYNAYTEFDVRFEKCSFNLDKNHNSIVRFSGFTKQENSRPELKKKNLPNVTMIDCAVNMPKGLKKWYVYHTARAKEYEGSFGNVSKVVIEGLSSPKEGKKMEIFSTNVKTVNKIKVKKQ